MLAVPTASLPSLSRCRVHGQQRWNSWAILCKNTLAKPEFVAAVRKALAAIGYVYVGKDYAGQLLDWGSYRSSHCSSQCRFGRLRHPDAGEMEQRSFPFPYPATSWAASKHFQTRALSHTPCAASDSALINRRSATVCICLLTTFTYIIIILSSCVHEQKAHGLW